MCDMSSLTWNKANNSLALVYSPFPASRSGPTVLDFYLEADYFIPKLVNFNFTLVGTFLVPASYVTPYEEYHQLRRTLTLNASTTVGQTVWQILLRGSEVWTGLSNSGMGFKGSRYWKLAGRDWVHECSALHH